MSKITEENTCGTFTIISNMLTTQSSMSNPLIWLTSLFDKGTC